MGFENNMKSIYQYKDINELIVYAFNSKPTYHAKGYIVAKKNKKFNIIVM